MRKRRKSKYTWMPTLGGVVTLSENTDYGITAFGNTLTPTLNQGVNTVTPSLRATSLVPDETFFPDQAAQGTTLRDLTEGQDWLLKRIVGKLFIEIPAQAPSSGQTNWELVWVAAAFFVARAQDDDPETPDLEPQEYDPWSSQQVRQPWIWRRSWLLRNIEGESLVGVPNIHVGVPPNNMLYPSALDGPHVDSKVARRIRREERLWFVASARGSYGFIDGSVNQPSEASTTVNYSLDYRILGAMRRSNNRSTF